MEESRAKTLDALSIYIQSQKAFLERTLVDIEWLKELRKEVAEQSEDCIDNMPQLIEKIQVSAAKLSEEPDVVARLPDTFDWSIFASQDPTPFKNLVATSRTSCAQSNGASKHQRSSFSPLQLLVKESQRTLIDPLVASFPPLSSDEEDEPPNPEEIRRQIERQKIRELKRQLIEGGASAYGGLGLRKPAPNGVYVRRDLQDESGEVDIGEEISVANPGKDEGPTATPSSSDLGFPMEVDTPATSLLASPASVKSSLPPLEPIASGKSDRQRQLRPTRKAAVAPSVKTQEKAKAKGPVVPMKEESDHLLPESHEVLNTEENVDKKGKPRPETYKQAWSVSEQHLLERLLEEIPDGEKNRWAKISKAMNGRRTPRQVASRVQKYFEKLKRFGVGVGKS